MTSFWQKSVIAMTPKSKKTQRKLIACLEIRENGHLKKKLS